MKTTLKTGISFLAVALVAGSLFSVPAHAQDAASIRNIQEQILQLQAQLKKLQADAAKRDAALKQAQDDVAQARMEAQAAQKAAAAQPVAAAAAAPAIPPGSALVTIPKYDPAKPNGKFNLGGVTVTLGGFVDVTGIYRTRNEARGTATSFGSVPFDQSADGHLGEARMTAQQSRFSILTQAAIDKDISVAAFGEADFNNGAGSANSVQSSSYTPRLRQAYAQIDDSSMGLHLLGGQVWSLVTPFKSGLTPRSELTPMTIDTAYVPGVAYTRAPEVRLTKDWGGKYWLALAADDAQTVFGGTAIAPSGSTLVTGSGTGTTSAGNGGLNPTSNYSYTVAPDLILKAAADTDFGHYEAFGVARWFKDRVEFASTPTKDATSITAGGGIGASAFVPLIPKYLELSGNVMYGTGIGRYGSGGMPDVTYRADGSLVPLKEMMGTIGLIGHPAPNVDVYAYYGLDKIDGKTFVSGGKTGGYGTGVGDNSGCSVEGSQLLAVPLACSGNNRALSEITGGFWWRFYQGPYGTVQTGAQAGFIKRQTFVTKGGDATAPETVVYAGLRYAPFN